MLQRDEMFFHLRYNIVKEEIRTMKKLFAVLLVMILLMPAVLAEPSLEYALIGSQVLGSSEYSQQVSILRVDVKGLGRDIPPVYVLIQYETAPEGYEPCFLEDVNFDGREDLVVTTMIGASNACYTFFLWDDAQGTFRHFGGEEVWNYQLYPAQKMIFSLGTSGWAGLLHESIVYGWDQEGRHLDRLRSSVWDTLVETTYEENGPIGSMIYTQRYDDTVIVETYTDYETGKMITFSNATADYDDQQFAAGRFLYEDEFLRLEVMPEDNPDGSNG